MKEHDDAMMLKAIFDNAIDGIITIDKKGLIEMINPAASKLFGYSEKELAGKSINVLMPQPYKKEHDGYIRRYQQTGEKKIIGIGREVEGERKDGSIFPFMLGVSEVIIGDESVYMGVVHDLSKQKEAEDALKQANSDLEFRVQQRTLALKTAVTKLEDVNEKLQEQIKEKSRIETALRESQKLYRLISRNFPKGTINVFDKELKYVFVEGKELYRLGIRSEMLIGTRFVDRLPKEVAKKTKTFLMKVFDGTPGKIEFKFKDNYYEINAVPLYDFQDNIQQILVVEQNITNEKSAELEMQKALKKEKQLNELKSRFVSMASHEFRTPLSAVLTSAELIKKYSLTEQQDKRVKHIQRIKSSVHNLTGILNDFLSLDKLEAGKIHYSPTSFGLKNLLDEVCEDINPLVKMGQKINCKYDERCNEVVLDKQMVKNIFINLLSNALKYSPENSNIDVLTGQEGNNITIKVTDCGIGIPEEDQANMFERFFRAQNATNIQGTGLGLNIVKKYIDIMKGKITFESQLSKGTTFYVTLPINLD